jgi:biopolymer transport protein ExbD
VRKARGPHENGIHEPNMTPLIDVSLVLVVILMVATPMAFQSSIAVSRAAASGREAEPTRTEWIEVTIVSDEVVLVNEQEVPRAALGPTLAARLELSPTRRVLVRCGDAVTHAAFVAVLDEAKAQGAAGIAVLGGTR